VQLHGIPKAGGHYMEEPNRRGEELKPDVPRSLSVFWANQLDRIKQCAESHANRTDLGSKRNERFLLDSGVETN